MQTYRQEASPITTMPLLNCEMPQELKKWNWGAFFFSMWWGIGHRVYITLLVLVPFVNIIWPIVCGLKGNEWAWGAGNYVDKNHFNAVMEPWNRAGKIAFFIMLIFWVFYFICAIVILLMVTLGGLSV